VVFLRSARYVESSLRSPSHKTFFKADVPAQGIPSPPQSPPLAASAIYNEQLSRGSRSKARRGGAASTITEECERLFCETLSAVFLGEKDLVGQDSLVAGMQKFNINKAAVDDGDNDVVSDVSSSAGSLAGRLMLVRGDSVTSEQSSTDHFGQRSSPVEQCIEMWDYKGDARFRGFVVDQRGYRTLFVFFHKDDAGKHSKSR